jgi:hypothetical protein
MNQIGWIHNATAALLEVLKLEPNDPGWEQDLLWAEWQGLKID